MSLSKAIGIVSGINEIGNFFQLFRSAVSYLRSRWSNEEQKQQIQEHEVQEQQIQEHEVLQLQSDLQNLSETLPSMYNLIGQAEWRSHERCVAHLLPKLKDAVYDAEELLDEFGWYENKVSIEDNNSTQLSSLIVFFHSVIQDSFNKVTHIQKRLTNLSSQLQKMGLHEGTTPFDKCIRPVTTSFATEGKIIGHENDMEEVLRLLGVPSCNSRSSSKRNRTCNAVINNEPRAASVPVLPIVGMGGLGKTTLAQEITTLHRVKSHFDKIIWISVCNEFDAERLTKVLIKSLSGKEAMANNFDDLQHDLAHEVGKKRFLLILDDIWLDAVKENGRNWRKFCAPLTNVLQGSRLLVTTGFVEVADIVGTMEPLALEGLKPEVFWDLFKLCVFGSENCHIDPQLELIGKNMLPKLKGSPLAAMTIGRLLRKRLTTKHWNDILNNELWQLQQMETDILPALRLSYMYLPFHLKRCFSFCALYPKDYNFRKASLAELWAAEGFVEPQGNIPLQHIGVQYFDDLVNLSFFQKLHGKYVIHDLIHDMIQLLSKDECFIVKKTSDIEKGLLQDAHHQLNTHALWNDPRNPIKFSLSLNVGVGLGESSQTQYLSIHVGNQNAASTTCMGRQMISHTFEWPSSSEPGEGINVWFNKQQEQSAFHSIPITQDNTYAQPALSASGVLEKIIELKKKQVIKHVYHRQKKVNKLKQSLTVKNLAHKKCPNRKMKLAVCSNVGSVTTLISDENLRRCERIKAITKGHRP